MNQIIENRKNMSKVYVVAEAKGKNFLPAKEFGELQVILHGGESAVQAYAKLEHVLRHFGPDDYLLLVGHPLSIGFAVHIVMESWHVVHFLIWDRTNCKYKVERIEYGIESIDESTSK